MKKYLLSMAVLLTALSCHKQPSDTPSTPVTPDPHTQDPTPAATIPTPGFAKGADISWVSEMEKNGRTFKKADGTPADILEVLKDRGINAIRLRVWVGPDKGWSGKDDVAALAERVTKAGLPLMVDFHYSDFFADPSRQKIPAAWEADKGDLSAMASHVAEHTTEVLKALKDKEVSVNWVQIGNETRAGMLFGTGDLVYADKGKEFANFIRLYNAGYDAVKALYPSALVMPHIDKAFDSSNNTWWFTSFKNQGGKMDMIALSHYPQDSWDKGSLMKADDANAKAIANIATLAAAAKVPVMISEVGVKTFAGEAKAKEILQTFLVGARASKDCAGVFYWEPETDGTWKPAVYSKPDLIKQYTGKRETWNAYDSGAFYTSGKPTSVMDCFLD